MVVVEMGIEVHWDNPEQTIVMIVYTRPWTWKDFDAAIEQMVAMFNSVNHQVDVVFNILDAGFPPADAMSHFKKAAEIKHVNGGMLIYVAPKVLTQFVNGIVRILTVAFAGSGTFETPKFIFTKSVEEARSYLLAHRTIKAS